MFRKIIISLIVIIIYSSNLVSQPVEIPVPAVAPQLEIKMLEDFEYENPSKVYFIDIFDRSDLKLFSTRDSFKGKYALKMDYNLSSDNMWGSKVTATREFDKPFNINSFIKGSIMVKGDGSLNTLMIQLIDIDGEIYTYEAPSALETSSWQEIVFSKAEFYIDESSKRSDGKLGKSIRAIRFIISNPFTESANGIIYLDRFRLFYSFEQFKKRMKERKSSQASSDKIFKNSYVDVEYRNINRYRSPGTSGYSKEFGDGNLLWFWFYLNTEYRYRYFLVTGLIGFNARDFSLSNERWGRYNLFGQDLKLIIDTSEFIKYTYGLVIGQLNPSYNRYLFYNNHQYWWEGVELNGRFFGDSGYDKTGYDVFYLKGWNDSSAIGLKTWYTLLDTKLSVSGVFAKDNALKFKNKYVFQSKNVITDNAYVVELNRGINVTSDGGFMVLWLTYGHHDYRRYGKIYVNDGNDNLTEITNEYYIIGDETDLGTLDYNKDDEGNPVYESLAKSVKKRADMGSFRLRIKDLPFKFLEEDIEVRYIGPYFKPRYSYRSMITSEQSVKLSLLFDFNPWATYKNWKLALNTKIAESTLPKSDPFYYYNFYSFEWNLGKHLGRLGVNYKQNYIWQKNPSSRDERLKSFWLYNYIIFSMKFSSKTTANLTLSDVNKKLYEKYKTDVNYYGTKFNFQFKVYFTEEALLAFDYIKTTPPDADVFANSWELDNLVKVALHIDFKL